MWKRQTRDWEQRKFGDIAQSFEYGLNAPAKEYDGTNKYLRITDIDDVSRKFNTDNLTSPDIELSTAKNYRLLNGDILFARTGASVGKSFIYRDSDGIVYFAGFLIRLEQELRRDMMHFYCFIYLLYIRNFLILTCTVYILAPHFANYIRSVTAVAV